MVAGAGYLALSLFVWVNLWRHHPTSVTTCGCGDTPSFTWYLAWPAHALTHGLSIFHSTAVGFPKGVNLLANTSELALGLVLAPVTWVFGPIATLNVALTLSPALSALAMFVLLRRWVSWKPAAFIGGLLYGFSPFVLAQLTESHLMFGMVAVPPLVVLCLDEMLVRQQRNQVRMGLLLGLLLTLQFFIGTETLLMMVMAGASGLLLLGIYAAAQRRHLVRRHLREAAFGLGVAGFTTFVLLAYPAWYSLAGPAHLAGPVWPGGYVGNSGTVLKDLVVPNQNVLESGISYSFNHTVGGYQGFLLSPQYLGIGLGIVLVIGLVLWRRDRRLWFFGATAVAVTALSIGEQYHAPLPWYPIANFPLVRNILPGRFILMTYLCIAVMLAVIVDHAHQAAKRRLRSPSWQARGAGGLLRSPALAPGSALLVAAVALVPPAMYLGQAMPFTTRPVVLPAWFRTVAPHLPKKQVLLVFPTPFLSPDNSKIWQAVDGFTYSMAEQGGPGGVPQRAGKERAGQEIINEASSPYEHLDVSPANVAAVRSALDGWRVTEVVIPDQPGLPVYYQIPSVTAAAALITAATGEAPVLEARAWVWKGVRHAAAPRLITGSEFARCTSGLPIRGAGAVETATACVTNAGFDTSGIVSGDPTHPS